MSHVPARPKRQLWVFPLAILLGTACGEAIGPDRTAAVRVAVDASSSSVTFAGLTVEVTGPGIADPIYGNLSDDGTGLWTGSLEVPVGSDRLFVVRGFEVDGMVTHKGDATIDVQETNGSLAILLSPLTGEVPVNGTIGSYDVVISPGVASLNVDETLTFTATISDQDGASVSDDVVWAVRNPAVVTIAPVGNDVGVTARLSGGATELVATYKGNVATATVTVN